MISFYNTHGKVSMTTGYFAELVSMAAQSGYGVAGMATRGPSDSIRGILDKDFPEKGVRVTEEDGKLVIELHIKVTYGLNIAAAVKSITHRVKYVVEEATGLSVKNIRVSVDDVVG
ncbi:Asp23/Gls24 family envelope stress response protein [Ruminococcaceae bacterium OttesenSCG-928-A11]|nr:Asp23/Gls24 family envelope stress response protein [Ruminococcaceae bacterium OttesenSCG-928-A11]